MAQTIIGAIVGSVASAYSIYEQKRSSDREADLAEKQYQAAKEAYENEAQERAKYNGTEPDIESLLEANTADKRAQTDLTGGKAKTTKTRLFNAGDKNALLGLGDGDKH